MQLCMGLPFLWLLTVVTTKHGCCRFETRLLSRRNLTTVKKGEKGEGVAVVQQQTGWWVETGW